MKVRRETTKTKLQRLQAEFQRDDFSKLAKVVKSLNGTERMDLATLLERWATQLRMEAAAWPGIPASSR
jgi:hypothetical protein